MNKFAMKENGFEYVDLGLPSKTMWATCNVGADKPEDEGLLFQFGRVDGYRYGDINNKFRTNKQNKQDTGNIFIPKTTSGKLYDTDEILDLKDDAAHVNMGGEWRMPTKYQIEELINNTTYEIKTINNASGVMFTSNMNGHHLFIPFTRGLWYHGTWYNLNLFFAYVWSSHVHNFNINSAYMLYCDLDGVANISDDTRSYALSVRGVFKK